MPLASEVFQEGLIIPPVKLVQRGKIVDDIIALILANVRTPDERKGDLTAQIAANRVGEDRLKQIIERYGCDRVTQYASAVQDYSERMMRSTISTVPDGDYLFEDSLDDDGFNEGRVYIRVSIRIAGDQATIDFTGTDKQTTGGINANFAITMSATLYVFRCLIQDEVLYNAGIARPLTIVASAGSVVNALHPAAVAGGNVETSQRITDVLLGALQQGLPALIPAASQGTMNNLTLGGTNSRTGERFAYYETIGGGMGAGASANGMSGVHTHMSNTRNTPIEVIEHYLPLRIRQYRLRRNSGGSGKFTGGDGIVREYEMLDNVSVTVLSDRREQPPYGADGGRPGAPGRNTVIRSNGIEERIPSKACLSLNAGDRLRIESPGGGGFGA
jgi:N-methylhydantoinase B/oxoprolinase/acetone carboxylase alpha subunit